MSSFLNAALILFPFKSNNAEDYSDYRQQIWYEKRKEKNDAKIQRAPGLYVISLKQSQQRRAT